MFATTYTIHVLVKCTLYIIAKIATQFCRLNSCLEDHLVPFTYNMHYTQYIIRKIHNASLYTKIDFSQATFSSKYFVNMHISQSHEGDILPKNMSCSVVGWSYVGYPLASIAEWLRAWDTLARMKLRRREVVSSIPDRGTIVG